MAKDINTVQNIPISAHARVNSCRNKPLFSSKFETTQAEIDYFIDCYAQKTKDSPVLVKYKYIRAGKIKRKIFIVKNIEEVLTEICCFSQYDVDFIVEDTLRAICIHDCGGIETYDFYQLNASGKKYLDLNGYKYKLREIHRLEMCKKPPKPHQLTKEDINAQIKELFQVLANNYNSYFYDLR